MGKGTQGPSGPEEPLNTCSDPEAQSEFGNAGKTNAEGSLKYKSKCKSFQKSPVLLPLCVFLVILTLILAVALAVVTTRRRSSQPEFSRVCPDSWPGFQGQCYYFSEDEANWTMSLESCRALGASLAILKTEEELDFALRYKSSADYWVGLEQRDDGWRWINGTALDPGFKVTPDKSCGYLNQVRISPSLCRTKKSWICSRPDNYIQWREGLGEP